MTQPCLECKHCTLPEKHNENCNCTCFTQEQPRYPGIGGGPRVDTSQIECPARLAIKGETYRCDTRGMHQAHGSVAAGAIWQAS